jgi:hypothetical protein
MRLAPRRTRHSPRDASSQPTALTAPINPERRAGLRLGLATTMGLMLDRTTDGSAPVIKQGWVLSPEDV